MIFFAGFLGRFLESPESLFKGPYLSIKLPFLPAKDSWEMLQKSLPNFTDDFLAQRNQPRVQKRESL